MSKSRLFISLLFALISTIFVLPVSHADEGCFAGLTLKDATHFQESQNYTGALTAFNCLISQDPDNARLYNLRGDVFRDLGDYATALVDYSQAISLNDRVAITYSNRGWIYYQQKDFVSALADLNHAIALEPALAYAYNNRGLVYHSMAEFDLALADFNKAIELGFDHIDWAEYNLAQLQSQTNLQSSSTATNTATLDLQAIYNAGIQAFIDGDYQNSVDLLENLLHEQADWEDHDCASCYLVSAYIKLGNYDKALEYITVYLQAHPNMPLAYLVRGMVYMRMGSPDKAQHEFGYYAATLRSITKINSDTIPFGDTETVAIRLNTGHQFSFHAIAGQHYHITAHTVVGSGDVDPLVIVLDINGNIVDGDDDGSATLFDADFIFTPSITCDYTLLITHAGAGVQGNVEVQIDLVD